MSWTALRGRILQEEPPPFPPVTRRREPSVQVEMPREISGLLKNAAKEERQLNVEGGGER